VRVLAASNVPLGDEVKKDRIRKDLFYRLNVLDIRIPPLRERSGDILTLFERFSRSCAQRNGDTIPPVPEAPFAEKLLAYAWPGNVRELENAAEKYVVLRRLLGNEGAASAVADSLSGGGAECGGDGADFSGTLDEIERRAVRAVFAAEGGNVSRAAKRLNVDRQTLRKKLDASKEGSG
jgi:DNA-binding NtrC family response regulator